VQHGQLDQPYLDAWAEILKVEDQLERLRAEAEPIDWPCGYQDRPAEAARRGSGTAASHPLQAAEGV